MTIETFKLHDDLLNNHVIPSTNQINYISGDCFITHPFLLFFFCIYVVTWWKTVGLDIYENNSVTLEIYALITYTIIPYFETLYYYFNFYVHYKYLTYDTPDNPLSEHLLKPMMPHSLLDLWYVYFNKVRDPLYNQHIIWVEDLSGYFNNNWSITNYIIYLKWTLSYQDHVCIEYYYIKWYPFYLYIIYKIMCIIFKVIYKIICIIFKWNKKTLIPLNNQLYNLDNTII